MKDAPMPGKPASRPGDGVAHGFIRVSVSPGLALRLEKAGAATADMWLALQLAHDLTQTRKHVQPVVRALAP
ncbi:MAG: hypothetical protein LBF61_13280 [Azoarcus sp.]|nr:hypothetical protein [Azoarcus sp.]